MRYVINIQESGKLKVFEMVNEERVCENIIQSLLSLRKVAWVLILNKEVRHDGKSGHFSVQLNMENSDFV